jgi:hypothetical protein
MSGHLPPAPPGNRSPKGPANSKPVPEETNEPRIQPENTSEQGDTANVRQNTTNKGFFRGRRVK